MTIYDVLDLAIEDFILVKVWGNNSNQYIFVGTVDECKEWVDENGDLEIGSWELGTEAKEPFIGLNVEDEVE